MTKKEKRNLIVCTLVVITLFAGCSCSLFQEEKDADIQIGVKDASDKVPVTDNGSSPGSDLSSIIGGDIFWIETSIPWVMTDRYGQRTEYKQLIKTNDVARAQDYVPFTIIVPTYLPKSKQFLPTIDIPLGASDNSSFRIDLGYGVLPDGYLWITEYTYPHTSTHPAYDPMSEQVEIFGKWVTRGKNNMWFEFESGNVSFIVKARKVPGEEVRKVAESMIQQLK